MTKTALNAPFRVRLPATSANLGPGFDALGVALTLYLTIEATVADAYGIDATGRDAALCGRVEDNLILTTFADVLANAGVLGPRLHLKLHNEIPLGMGCGSSAAALLAGVMLADHFGGLGWSSEQVLEEACRREGHPDNVAACHLGGMTASAMTDNGVVTATCGMGLDWRFFVALPSAGLATSKARAMLPAKYTREDAVTNIQATALLVAAFHQGRGELLRMAMQDRIHQPYRMEACPLLARLLPLTEDPAVLGVALSGAGPSVLVVAEAANAGAIPGLIRKIVGDPGLEVLETSISAGAAR